MAVISTTKVIVTNAPQVNNNGKLKKRRDRHDIVSEILTTATEGRIKTHIMYKAKLSYSELNEYLPELIRAELLKTEEVRRKRDYSTIYKTTPKGISWLNNYQYVKNAMAEIFGYNRNNSHPNSHP